MIQETGHVVVPAVPTVADALVAALVRLGARTAFGVLGGSVAPFARALEASPIALVHTRHEAGAAFAALEAALASDRPALVFTTTGPGLTNALTGIAAARWEGARVVAISGVTARERRGRWAFQETSDASFPLVPDGLFELVATIDDDHTLDRAIVELARGLARPQGFVAHIRIPLDVQLAPAAPRDLALGLVDADAPDEAAARVAELLDGKRFAIWAGYGARHAAGELRELAERTGAPVMTSPRGKGVFPEDHPQWLGVTGLGAHPVAERLRAHAPARVLVLGTRLGEMTSFWDRALVPAGGLVHVDLDERVPGAAYPDVPTVAVRAEIGALLRALVPRMRTRPRAVASEPSPAAPLALRDAGAVRPSALMREVQRAVVDGSDAIVLAEAGNAYAWATHALRFATPGRWRVSTGFGAMGQAATGVIGAAIAHGRAVALVGDGAMLMNNELTTAVVHGLRAAWIVLDDARYGMIEQGMAALGWTPFATRLPTTDFAAVARAMGVDAVRVEHERELPAALARAAAADGPFLVDVAIDPHEPAPATGRNRSLATQLGALT